MAVVIQGENALMDTLQALDEKVRRRIMRRALNLAAEPLKASASRRVVSVSPTVAGAMGATVRQYKQGRILTMRVGPRSDQGAWSVKTVKNPFTGLLEGRIHKPGNTAHLIEGGTKAHSIRLPGRNITIKHPGTAPAPFLKPAHRVTGPKVQKTFIEVAWAGIRREAQRKKK